MPALVLSVLQWVVLAALTGVAVIRASVLDATFWVTLQWLLVGAAVVVPFNLLLIGLENVLFLLFPSRLLANTPGDFQAMGRGVLVMVAKILLLGIVGGVAFLAGFIVYGLSGESILLAVAAGWIVLADGAAVLVPVAGLVFMRIDISRDKPA